MNAHSGRTDDLTSPELSPREKRKVLLPLANPKPGCNPVISLLHFERKQRQGFAQMNEAGQVVILEVSLNDKVDMAERFAARRIGHVRGNPSLPISTFAGGPGQSAVDLWPVIPHVSGRPLDDFLGTESRNRRGAAEKPQAVAPQPKRS